MCFLIARLVLLIAISCSAIASTLPGKSIIAGVPFTRQMDNYCGPAALCSLLSFWGAEANQKEIGKCVYDADKSSTTAGDLLLYCRERGLAAYSFNGTLESLKSCIAQGIPVVVLQDLSSEEKMGHFRLAVGYDDAEGKLILRDSNKSALLETPYPDFMELWKQQACWAMAAAPRGKELPLKQNSVTHMDLAIAYLRRGDFPRAEVESLAALEIEPGNRYALKLLEKAKEKSSKPVALN